MKLARIFRFLFALGFLALGTLFIPVSWLPERASSPLTPHPVAPRNLPLENFILSYDRWFAEGMTRTQTPGAAVVIVKDGQVLFQKGYGLRAIGQPDSVDAGTIFRVGSLSKGFSSVLAGVLVQQGVLTWQEPVQHLVPQFNLRDRAQAARINLTHLLSHTTGLPYHAYTHLIEQGYDLATLMKYKLPSVPLAWKEGEAYSYQNAVFCVVEPMMQAATGETFQQLLKEKIFKPAGMEQASCDFSSITADKDKALPHFFTRLGWQSGEITDHYYNATAAGGINASITDMAQWLKVLQGKRPDVVSEATLDRVFTPVIKTGRERQIFPGWIPRDSASYALGWRVLEDGADTLLYHSGSVNGYRAEIALNRKDGIAVCVLFNACTELGRECVPAFFKQWDAVRGSVAGWP